MTRILVVDDLKDITETMGVLFEALGHDTRVAADGRQAVETTLAFEPDIVFLDLEMPVLTLHTTGDGLVVPQSESAYASVVRWAGNSSLLRELFTVKAPAARL